MFCDHSIFFAVIFVKFTLM